MSDVTHGDNRLPVLAAEINRAHELAQQHAKNTVECAMHAGELLIEAKSRVGHGEWQTWLRENITVTPRMAQQYMRLARELPNLSDEKRNAVSHLPIRHAIAQLAQSVPALVEMDGDAIGRVVKLGESGGRLTKAVRSVRLEIARKEYEDRGAVFGNWRCTITAPRTKREYLATRCIPPDYLWRKDDGTRDGYVEWHKLKSKTKKLPEFADLQRALCEAQMREAEIREQLREASDLCHQAYTALDRAVDRHLLEQIIPDDFYDGQWDDHPGFRPITPEHLAIMEDIDA